MIHAFKQMFVGCSTQLLLFLAQLNSCSPFSLQGNMQYAKKPHSIEMTGAVAKLKHCFQLWF